LVANPWRNFGHVPASHPQYELALGLGVVSYVGVNAGIDVFRGYFNSAMGNAGAIMAGMAGVLQLDVVLSIFVAAGLARLAIAGATSGTLKRFTLK
jgi:hypothetical protein